MTTDQYDDIFLGHTIYAYSKLKECTILIIISHDYNTHTASLIHLTTSGTGRMEMIRL